MSDSELPEVDLVTLRRGSRIPILGFGTSRITGGAAYDAVATALELGYRHIDTAERDLLQGAEARRGTGVKLLF